MFRDLGGAVHHWEELREMHIDSGNVLAVPDPGEVGAPTSRSIKIDQVVITRTGLRSDKELRVANLAN